jgi:hypothetical protein
LHYIQSRLFIAHGKSRLLVGAPLDGDQKLGKFVARSQDEILEKFP